MKKIKILFALMIALVVVFGFSVTSHATLTTIGTATYGGSDYNLIYDNDLNITWLDYSNDNDYWTGQMDWAAGLNGGGVLTYNLNAGVTASWVGEDWRLPTVIDVGNDGCNFSYDGTDCGANVDTSTGEMAHLFYTELGNTPYYDTSGNGEQIGWGLTNTGDFDNLITSLYWSGTEYSPNPDNAWFFVLGYGFRNHNPKGGITGYALAVRSGDVSVGAVVPEPSTYLLLGSGIAGLILWRRKRNSLRES